MSSAPSTPRLAFAALVSVGLLAASAPEARAEGVEVTVPALNVRNGPSTKTRVVDVVRKGQTFTVRGRRGSWVRIRQGYVHKKYVRGIAKKKKSSGTTRYYVTADVLNVRSGPATRYRKLGTLGRGKRVNVRAKRGAWLRLEFSGRVAYVNAAHMSRKKPRARRSSSKRRSRAGFVQLSGSGRGFYGYSISSGRWGIPSLIYGIERVGRRWAQLRMPRMGIGHISRQNGGTFRPHSSHRYGKDADVRPVRRDRAAAPTTIYSSSYSRARTQKLINIFRNKLSERVILFNDRRVRGRASYPGHDNHFHFSHR